MSIRKCVFVVSIIVVFVIIGGWVAVRLRFHSTLKVSEAAEQAVALMTKAGGAEKVCKDADRIFHNFGVTNLIFFQSSDLENYPAIAALGDVDGIFPGPPAYVKVRVGGHLNGYIIQIVDTNTEMKYLKSTDDVEIVRSRVFVHE